MAELVVTAGALPSTAAALRRQVDDLGRAVDDADRYVSAVRTAWDGAASDTFAGAWTDWRDASVAVRAGLEQLRTLLETTDTNHRIAQDASVRAWSPTAGGAGPPAVLAMSAGPGLAPEAPPWVTLSTPEIVRAALVTAEVQYAVGGAAGRGVLEASAGFAGDDAALGAWRGRYDALARRTWSALGAGVAIFGGMAVGLTDTANAWVEADETAVPGGRPGERLPAPAVLPGLAGAGPAPSTGPGPVGPVPDVVAAYVPDVDAARVEEVGEAWRAIGDAVARGVVEVDGALRAVHAANAGPVFDAIDRYWRGVQGAGSETVLELATRVPGVLATSVAGLADIVRETQREILDAIHHHPIGDDEQETYYLLQGAKIGASFLLGGVGRVGTRLIDAAETGLRIHLARGRYEDRVAELARQLDQQLISRLVDATREPRTVESVAPQFAPPPTIVGDIPLPPLRFDRVQLEEKFREHYRDFGLSDTSTRNRQLYQDAAAQIATDAGNVHIHGTYRGTIEVIFHVDPRTGLMVMQRENGSFLSAYGLQPDQLRNVLERQRL
ncbi:WXG100 family type VII secretion target [Actinomycetospora aeridis]|uniref:WXG100 family type VII secretion target n=1 Tax=Actinomycetospora aeridis TaxID=3129231 RepID=A0ABU8N8S7_9PSEU